MKLHAALGASMQDAAKMGVAFAKALDIAESLGDIEYQLRALRGLYFHHTGSSRYSAALPFAQKFYDLATSGSDPSDRQFGERMMGVARHFLGDHDGARPHLERALTGYVATDHRPDVIRFQTDLRVSAYAFLSRVLWFQGYADQAMRAAEASVAEALATGHALSLSHALAIAACPIALWIGNLDVAKRYTGMLLAQSRQHSVFHWDGFGARFRAILALKGANLDTGSQLPHSHDDDYVGPNLNFPFLTGLTELAEALSDVGRTSEALALLEPVKPSEAGWLTPELLRVKGTLLLLQNTPAVPEAAEDHLRQALDVARQQEALSWELRAATSLAPAAARSGPFPRMREHS
jgi:Tetratricopeptide repeat